jgi:hypothetical protein
MHNIEAHAPFVPVMGAKVRAVKTASETTERVARSGPLNFDNFCAEVSQKHCSERRSDKTARLDNPHS